MIERFLGLASIGLVLADDLQPLGDEFDNAASIAQWSDLGIVEGWGTPSVQERDIDTTTPGHFRIQPGALTWFRHLRGALFFKEITGDFVVTAKLRILSRHNPADPTEVPNRSFSLSGLLVHGPRAITQAAPDPYRTDAVWPPQDFGSDYIPNTENYIFLAYGTAGNAGTRQFEIKATRNSNSRLYFDNNGVGGNEVWLQMVRVGDTVVCLRKHSENGDWLVENRYPNDDHPFPDFGATLQVGLTAYTDWPTSSPFNSAGLEASYHFNYAPPTNGQPDLVSEVDFFRIQRPDPALTEVVLQGMSVNYNPATNTSADPPVTLSASPAASPHLGEAAHLATGVLTVEDLVVNESEGSATLSVTRTGAADGEVSLQFSTLAGSAMENTDFTPTSGSLTWNDGVSGAQTINIPLIDDGSGEGLEQFTLALTEVRGPSHFEAGQLTRNVSVTIVESGYDLWRLEQFGENAHDPTAAADVDFDNDGLVNLLEYVLAASPIIADPTPLPSYLAAGGDPEFRFIPNAAASDITLVIEASETLQAGSWNALATRSANQTAWVENSEDASVLVDPETGEVTLSDAVDSDSSRFLRLRATIE